MKGIVICCNDLQFSNEFSSIDIIECGNFISCIVEQSRNIEFWIFVISPNISSDLTPSKELLPNDRTDEGIVICFKEKHPLKTQLPIDITDGGIVIVFNDKHFIKEQSLIYFNDEGSSNETLNNDKHPSNAFFSIEVIDCVIVNCLKFVKL